MEILKLQAHWRPLWTLRASSVSRHVSARGNRQDETHIHILSPSLSFSLSLSVCGAHTSQYIYIYITKGSGHDFLVHTAFTLLLHCPHFQNGQLSIQEFLLQLLGTGTTSSLK